MVTVWASHETLFRTPLLIGNSSFFIDDLKTASIASFSGVRGC